jgi:hypothetical protein
MATKNVEITVTDLTFPANLEDKFCKFRPLITLRYKDSADKTANAREALPGVGPRDYWECEKGNKDKPNYVRHATLPKVDMEKVDVMQRRISFENLDLKTVDSIEIEIFDVDIKTGFEKLAQNILKALPADVLLSFVPGVPVSLKLVQTAVEQATGQTLPGLQKTLIKRLIGVDDGTARSIWAKSKQLADPPPSEVTVAGPGAKGNFSVSLEISVE